MELFWACNLAPTGKDKNRQGTISRELIGELSVDGWTLKKIGEQKQWKESVHLVWWRWENGGALIPAELEISHADADNRVLRVVAESHEFNESRKWCHYFGRYKTNVMIQGSRRVCDCYHHHFRCTGPQ